MRSVKLQVTLPEEQYELLSELARRLDRGPDEISAEAIQDFLEHKARQREGFHILRTMPQRAAPGTDESPHDLAQNHDKYLYSAG